MELGHEKAFLEGELVVNEAPVDAREVLVVMVDYKIRFAVDSDAHVCVVEVDLELGQEWEHSQQAVSRHEELVDDDSASQEAVSRHEVWCELDLPGLQQAKVLLHCEVLYLGEDEDQGVFGVLAHGAMAQQFWLEGLDVVDFALVAMEVDEMGLDLIHLACSAKVGDVLQKDAVADSLFQD